MSIYGSSLYKEDKTWIKLLIFEPSSGGNYLSEVLSLYIGFHSIARSKSKERKLRMSIPSTFLYLVGVLFHTVHLKVSWATQNLIKKRFIFPVSQVYAPGVGPRKGHLGILLAKSSVLRIWWPAGWEYSLKNVPLSFAKSKSLGWRTVTEEKEKKKGWVWRILELGYKQLNRFSILVNRIQCISWIDLFCLCFNLIRNQASVNFPNFSKLKGGGISRQRLCRKFIWMETPLIFISSWCTRATKVVFSKNEILCLSVQFYL